MTKQLLISQFTNATFATKLTEEGEWTPTAADGAGCLALLVIQDVVVSVHGSDTGSFQALMRDLLSSKESTGYSKHTNMIMYSLGYNEKIELWLAPAYRSAVAHAAALRSNFNLL